MENELPGNLGAELGELEAMDDGSPRDQGSDNISDGGLPAADEKRNSLAMLEDGALDGLADVVNDNELAGLERSYGSEDLDAHQPIIGVDYEDEATQNEFGTVEVTLKNAET